MNPNKPSGDMAEYLFSDDLVENVQGGWYKSVATMANLSMGKLLKMVWEKGGKWKQIFQVINFIYTCTKFIIPNCLPICIKLSLPNWHDISFGPTSLNSFGHPYVCRVTCVVTYIWTQVLSYIHSWTYISCHCSEKYTYNE